jgi:hypothetical protein
MNQEKFGRAMRRMLKEKKRELRQFQSEVDHRKSIKAPTYEWTVVRNRLADDVEALSIAYDVAVEAADGRGGAMRKLLERTGLGS